MPSIVNQDILVLEQQLNRMNANASVQWSTAANSHVGRVRMANEDDYLEVSEQGLWVVADGMGGHSRGACASKAIVSVLSGFKKQDKLSANLTDLETRLNEAHQKCRGMSNGKTIGSTVVLLFEFEQHCFFIWSGDSRIYRLRDNQLKMVTCDHSLAQEKFTHGKLDLKDAVYHPSAHILTQAVGVHRDLRLEMRYDKIKTGDRYLICSDGLYNDIYSFGLQAQLSQGSPEEALKSLIDHALDKGGRDNITGIILDAN